jgi:predicted Zn-dependent peptidase
MPGISIHKAEQAIRDELKKLAEEGPLEYELQKVKNKVESNLVFGEIHYLNKAMNLAQFELLGNIDAINDEPKKYRAVTQDEIKSVASKIFTAENCSTLYYIPVNQK